MGWVQKLQSRWKVNTTFQVMIILAVFALTGLTVAYIMKPVLKYFFGASVPVWGWVLYIILILPVYNFFLLFYGFVFGKFYFFWNFEKQFFKRLLNKLK